MAFIRVIEHKWWGGAVVGRVWITLKDPHSFKSVPSMVSSWFHRLKLSPSLPHLQSLHTLLSPFSEILRYNWERAVHNLLGRVVGYLDRVP